MAKVKVKNQKALNSAKEKLRGGVAFAETKHGIIAKKWPRKKTKKSLYKIQKEKVSSKLSKNQGVKDSAVENLMRFDNRILKIGKIKNFNDQTEMVNKIIVGDCLEVMKNIKDNTFDMIFADPPYNMQLQNELYRPNNTKVDAVDDEWDKFSGFAHYDEFTKAWMSEAKRILKKNGTIWVIGSYHNIFRVGNIMQDMGYWILNDIHWIKANPMPNFKGVRLTNASETLIWAVKDKNVKNYTFNYEEMKKHNFGKQMRNDWYFAICNGTERLRDEKGAKIHSTQKPLPLLERIVLASTKKGDLIFDPFGGTGTTGVAAYKHDRNFTMVEKDEYYVDWALKRFNQLQNKLI